MKNHLKKFWSFSSEDHPLIPVCLTRVVWKLDSLITRQVFLNKKRVDDIVSNFLVQLSKMTHRNTKDRLERVLIHSIYLLEVYASRATGEVWSIHHISSEDQHS